MRARLAAGAALGLLCLALAGCNKGSTAVAAAGSANPCADAETFTNIKSIIFDNAANADDPEDKLIVPELATQSEFTVSRPVVDELDKAIGRTTCSGRAEITFPTTATTVIGASTAAAEIRFSVQGAADGSGVVYTVFGAEDLIGGIAAADLRSWARQAVPAPPAEGRGPTAQVAAAAAAPPPSAGELLRNDPQLAAREQALRALYQNAAERDVTGQVEREQSAALAARAACHTRECLASWFAGREAVLRAFDDG